MTRDEKAQSLGLLVNLLQENTGNRITPVLIRGLVGVMDEAMAITKPPPEPALSDEPVQPAPSAPTVEP